MSVTCMSSPSTSSLMSRKRKMVLEPSVGDRYIPTKVCFEEDLFKNCPQEEKEENRDYANMLRNHLGMNKKTRVLTFGVPAPKSRFDPRIDFYKDRKEDVKKVTKDFRYVSSCPVRILDAPNIDTDVYKNVLSWSNQNILAVALGETLYAWNATDSTIKEIELQKENTIYSVAFNKTNGRYLNINCSDDRNLIYDLKREKTLRRINVGCAQNNINVSDFNKELLTVGLKDSRIMLHDIREKDSLKKTLEHHSSQITNLEWNQSKTKLATSSSDGTAQIYDIRADKIEVNLTGHSSSVTGLAWSKTNPHLLATGGGNLDKTIKLWDSKSATLLDSYKCSGPVTGIKFNPFEKEFVASSGKMLQLFQYPQILKAKDLKGHEENILNLQLSPCNTTVVSAGGDETLRFWRVFQEIENKRKPETPDMIRMNRIR